MDKKSRVTLFFSRNLVPFTDLFPVSFTTYARPYCPTFSSVPFSAYLLFSFTLLAIVIVILLI